MVLKNLSNSELKHFLDMSEPDYIQHLSSLKKQYSFRDLNNKLNVLYGFYIDNLKLGDLFFVLDNSITLQSFYPLKEKPFLKRNGVDENSEIKKNSYHLGLLSNALFCSEIKPKDKNSYLFELSRPIEDLAKKFYANLNIDIEETILYSDFSKKIFYEANKRGFNF